MSTSQKPKKTSKSFLQKNWQYLLVGLICCLYLLWAIPHWVFKPEEAGQFGDLFGTITAIIGSLTFFYLIKSIKLQQRELGIARKALKISNKELKLSRKELELTRGELRLSREEMEKQSKTRLHQQTARVQRIENTFFNLISLLHHIQENIVAHQYKGRPVFFQELLKKKAKFVIPYNDAEYEPMEPSKLRKFHWREVDMFVELYKPSRSEDTIYEFYNHFINVMTFISTSGVSEERKHFFVKTFCGLLSRYEILLVCSMFNYTERWTEQGLIQN